MNIRSTTSTKQCMRLFRCNANECYINDCKVHQYTPEHMEEQSKQCVYAGFFLSGHTKDRKTCCISWKGHCNFFLLVYA